VIHSEGDPLSLVTSRYLSSTLPQRKPLLASFVGFIPTRVWQGMNTES
jgi:hypothetical protein